MGDSNIYNYKNGEYKINLQFSRVLIALIILELILG